MRCAQVSQYKTGKASLSAQGKRRYDKKQAQLLSFLCTLSTSFPERKPLAKGRLRWTDQADLPQEGTVSNAIYEASPFQAKTTKKIVLKLECTKCKARVLCFPKVPQNFK